jgi:ABC-type xylose transport system permease subunit
MTPRRRRRRSKTPTVALAAVRIFVAVAVVAALVWTLARGSPLWFLVIMVIIGIGFRLIARAVVRRRGEKPPRGWWV